MFSFQRALILCSIFKPSPRRSSCLRLSASHPSDLSEAQWKLIAPLIPVPQSYGRPSEYELREIVNTIFYVLRSGCPWRMLPHDFLPLGTVYHYFQRWSKNGVFEQMNAQLRGDLRERLGRSREASASILDSQSVKITVKVGSMAMMGQKNKRSQAAYPRRYPGTSAENQGSCSRHHGSGRSETAVVPTPKRAFLRGNWFGPTWVTVGSILLPGLKKRSDGRYRPSRALENGFGSEGEEPSPATGARRLYNPPQALGR